MAEQPLHPVQQRQDKLQRARRRVRRALAQPGVDQVAELGEAGHQRMIDALVVVAVVLRTRLMTRHFDGQRIHIDGHVAQAVAAPASLDLPRGGLQQRLAQHAAIVRGAQHARQAGERRLRGQSVGLLRVLGQRTAVRGRRPSFERRDAAAGRDGEAQDGVVAQGVGVVLVAPALAQQQQRRVQQLDEWVRHEFRVAGVRKPLGQPARHAEPLDDLAQQHRAGLGGQAFRPRLDAQRTVEIQREKCQIGFTHWGPPGAVLASSNTVILHRFRLVLNWDR